MAFPKKTGSETAEMRAAINVRISEKCETLFDGLANSAKARLRGRASGFRPQAAAAREATGIWAAPQRPPRMER
jgi:hypothetical protein